MFKFKNKHMKNSMKTITNCLVVFILAFSVLLVAPQASAAELVAGDLIKTSVSTSVYYYSDDGKRYVFPNLKTYNTWYSDFSKIKIITQTELANIMIGGNVTYRSGTRLVKITTDPKVYAVTGYGTLHAIHSEDVALALYGLNWNKLVDDVPDAFFVNYNVGAKIINPVHPNDTLIRHNGFTYIMQNGAKRRLEGNSFAENNFLDKYIIDTTTNYPVGSQVTKRESNYTSLIALDQTPCSTGIPCSEEEEEAEDES